ncbi:MAG: LPS assembly protein LptD [Desulfobacterales bacterium]
MTKILLTGCRQDVCRAINWIQMSAIARSGQRTAGRSFRKKSGAAAGPFFLRWPVSLWALLAVALMVGLAGGRAAARPALTDDPDQPWHITADEISYDDKLQVYIARGNVDIAKLDRRLKADFARFDYRNMLAVASGNVIMTVGQDVLSGERMEMDLGSETGTVYGGGLFVEEKHFFIKGETIQKVGPRDFKVQRAILTSCDGDPPAWKITGRNLKVALEGYGTVTHPVLWVRNVPVFYAPFMFFPVKQKRQSGLLTPEVAVSDRLGSQYVQPFFWAINDSSDATFYVDYMSDRGVKTGAEYRYMLDEYSKGVMMFDYLDDRKVDDGSGSSSSDYGYTDDAYLRPNSDRYWFRMKADQALPQDFFARLDLDFVSDQDYLKEFQDGYAGYTRSDRMFERLFGRDLDDKDDAIRSNSLSINRIWSRYSFNALTNWEDDVIARRQGKKNTAQSTLPAVGFTGLRQPLPGSPLYFDFTSSYFHNYTEDANRNQRVDVHPRVYWPFRWQNYLSVNPSAGLRQTVWYIDRFDDASIEDDRTLSRELYDLRLDLSTNVFKTYKTGVGGIDRIRHTLRPQVVYDFIPDKDSDRFPDFDRIDSILKKNRTTYSLTNTLTARHPNAPRGEAEGPPDFAYREFLRFKLEQSYDITEANENDPKKLRNQETLKKEPFTPLSGELELVPGRYLALRADAEWSVYEDTFLSRNFAARITDLRGDHLFIEQRFTRDSRRRNLDTGTVTITDRSQTLYADTGIRLADWLWAYGEYEYNLEDELIQRAGFGLTYIAQCWSVGLGYLRKDEDRQIAFMVSLRGLGTLGEMSLGRSIASPLDWN